MNILRKPIVIGLKFRLSDKADLLDSSFALYGEIIKRHHWPNDAAWEVRWTTKDGTITNENIWLESNLFRAGLEEIERPPKALKNWKRMNRR